MPIAARISRSITILVPRLFIRGIIACLIVDALES